MRIPLIDIFELWFTAATWILQVPLLTGSKRFRNKWTTFCNFYFDFKLYIIYGTAGGNGLKWAKDSKQQIFQMFLMDAGRTSDILPEIYWKGAA